MISQSPIGARMGFNWSQDGFTNNSEIRRNQWLMLFAMMHDCYVSMKK